MSTIADLPDGWVRLVDPVEEEWGLDSGMAARGAWFGPWESRHQARKAFGGLPQTITYPGGISVTRLVPMKYPATDPDFDWCYCTSARMSKCGRPASGGDIGISFAYAKIVAEFQTRGYFNFGGDAPLCERSYGTGADIITIPGSAFKFPSDGVQLNQDAGPLVPWREYQWTFFNVPTSDDALYDSLTGRVNSVDFVAPNGVTYAPGYMQYLGPSGGEQVSTGGVYTWTISHRFKWRYIPHNAIGRPDGAGFEVPEDPLGNPPIESADLNLIYA